MLLLLYPDMINYSKPNYIIRFTRSILHPLGAFGSKCASAVYGTVWIHKNTCVCEKKTLVEYFKKKVSLDRSFSLFRPLYPVKHKLIKITRNLDATSDRNRLDLQQIPSDEVRVS